MSETILNVNLKNGSYNILIGEGFLKNVAEYLSPVLLSKRVCIVTDKSVAEIYLRSFILSLEKSGFEVLTSIILQQGEYSKNFEQLQFIISEVSSNTLSRDTALIALGGGVVGDITGFAASIIMRGIPFVQIPTTLLAQVDSSVGGKTGINTPEGKNMVGTFYQPKIVLIDTETLTSLPDRQMKAGYAEILKYALINDPDFFEWLESNGESLIQKERGSLLFAVEKSCSSKASIVKKDPCEREDIRVLLNLGHSFAHALEALGDYDGKILHGEAVSIGILMAYEFSEELGLCPSKDVERLKAHVLKMGLVQELPFNVKAKDVLALIKKDKKAQDGHITLILAKAIGKTFVEKNVDETVLKKYLDKKFK